MLFPPTHESSINSFIVINGKWVNKWKDKSEAMSSSQLGLHSTYVSDDCYIKPSKVNPGQPNPLFMDVSLTVPRGLAKGASLSSTISWSLLKLMMMSVRLSSLLVLCGPLLLLPSVLPSIKVFSMSQLFASGGQRIGASTSVLPMNIQGWIFKIVWFDLLGVQGTLKSLLQHHNYSEF